MGASTGIFHFNLLQMFIIIAVLILVCLLCAYVYRVVIAKKAKKYKDSQLLLQCSLAGCENNLSFSCQELLSEKMICLDGRNRKLFFLLQLPGNRYNKTVINLDELSTCSIIKDYSNICAATWKNSQVHKHLQKIGILLHFKNKSKPAEFLFYDRTLNRSREQHALEKKARYWQAILLRMLKPSQLKTTSSPSAIHLYAPAT